MSTFKLTQHGITLIELMIVVVIVSVLALILYPNYSSSVRKAKRSDALKSIQETSNRLEKYMTYCNSYTTEFGGTVAEDSDGDKCTGLGISAENSATHNSEGGHYSLAIACSNSCMAYEITATAQASQLKDTDCKVFKYTSTGAKTATNSSDGDSSQDCWR